MTPHELYVANLMHQRGFDANDVAKALGLTQVREPLLPRSMRLKPHRPRHILTKEEGDRMIGLRLSGMSYAEVARAMMRSYASVYPYLKTRGY